MRRCLRPLWGVALLGPGLAASSAAAPMSDAVTYTVSVGLARPATLAPERLTLRLTGVQDSRCPVGAACLWAGHAAVTVSVSRPGTAAQSVVIGTAAPANLNLPGEATLGPYTFALRELTPRPTAAGGVPLSRYTATVVVVRR